MWQMQVVISVGENMWSVQVRAEAQNRKALVRPGTAVLCKCLYAEAPKVLVRAHKYPMTLPFLRPCRHRSQTTAAPEGSCVSIMLTSLSLPAAAAGTALLHHCAMLPCSVHVPLCFVSHMGGCAPATRQLAQLLKHCHSSFLAVGLPCCWQRRKQALRHQESP